MARGVLVLLVALLAASLFGAYRRATDGRIRGVRPRMVAEPGRPALAAAAGLSWAPPGEGGAPDRLTASDVGADLGTRATLLQFSTVFCQPCRSTRRLLAEVAGMVEGVRHIDVDAESHLALVRRLDVIRTPTVFVLDSAGTVTRRAVGIPRKADLVAALGDAIR